MIGGSGAAMAGEITGNGDPTGGVEHSHSWCVYSGFNDTPDEDAPFGGIVQSYGHYVSQGFKDAEFAPSPGIACNPTTNPR